MKLLSELLSLREDAYEEKLRADGKLDDRLRVIDQNIKMFSAPLYDKNANVQRQLAELKHWRELFVKFYAGEIAWKDVPYRAWELTTGLPDWATRGT